MSFTDTTEGPTRAEAVFAVLDLIEDEAPLLARELSDRFTMAACPEEADIIAARIDHTLEHLLMGEDPCGWEEC